MHPIGSDNRIAGNAGLEGEDDLGEIHRQLGPFEPAELAVAAGRDPYEYRRELLAGSPRFLAVLDLAAEKAGWSDRPGRNRGRGIAIHRSFGTIVAQVVDVEIADGKPRARRVVCAVDPGFAVHPDNLAAQMESGIAYGLTAALYGEISIRDGAVAQSNFHDYRMLRMDEAPDVETYIINGGGSTGGGTARA